MPQQTGYRVYKSDAAKAKVYDHRIRMAQDEKDAFKNSAEEAIKRYENKGLEGQSTPQGTRVNSPSGIAIIDALFSSLTATAVDILVEPTGSGTLEQAELATAALSKEWENCKVNERVEPVVKDALLIGIGWAKVGYEYVTTTNEVPRPMKDITADIGKVLDEADAAGLPRPTADVIHDLVPLTETQETVVRDRVVVDHVPWDQVLWDPTAKRVEDVRWVAQLTLMHPDEVKANPAWRKYVKRSQGRLQKLNDVKADVEVEGGMRRSPEGKPATQDDERTTIVEFHDFETGTICTFVKGADWLLNEQENPFAFNLDYEDRSCFVPLILRSSPSRLRGISEMDVLMPTLREKDLYRSRLATYLERMAPKVLGPEDGLTDAGKTALKSSEYGAYVEYSREGGADGNAFKPLEPPALPAQVFDMDGRAEQEGRDATGVNELMRGLFPDRKRTATETSEVVSASAARQAEKRNRLEAFYIRIAKRMLQLMQAYYDQPRMLHYITPIDQRPVWGEWTAEDIQFEYNLRLSLTPLEASTMQSRRDEVLTVLNVFGPLAQPGPDGSSIIDPQRLVQWAFRRWGLSPQDIGAILSSEEQKQKQRVEQQQAVAGQAYAAAGAPRADMAPGPLNAEQAAAAANSGAVPPELLAGAAAGGPLAPELTEQVSESAGVRT